MRSFGRALAAAMLLAAGAYSEAAQGAAALYADMGAREAELRRDLA